MKWVKIYFMNKDERKSLVLLLLGCDGPGVTAFNVPKQNKEKKVTCFSKTVSILTTVFVIFTKSL